MNKTRTGTEQEQKRNGTGKDQEQTRKEHEHENMNESRTLFQNKNLAGIKGKWNKNRTILEQSQNTKRTLTH